MNSVELQIQQRIAEVLACARDDLEQAVSRAVSDVEESLHYRAVVDGVWDLLLCDEEQAKEMVEPIWKEVRARIGRTASFLPVSSDPAYLAAIGAVSDREKEQAADYARKRLAGAASGESSNLSRANNIQATSITDSRVSDSLNTCIQAENKHFVYPSRQAKTSMNCTRPSACLSSPYTLRHGCGRKGHAQ